MEDIRSVAERFLGKGQVLLVREEPSVNRDNAEISNVLIVYRNELGVLDAEKMAGVTEEIWKQNISAGISIFPVVTFVAEADGPVLHAAE